MGASPKGDRATSLRPQPASQSSRSGIPSAAKGLQLCKMFGEELRMCEPVMFVKGAPAVDTIILRARIGGKAVVGESIELGDYWADILDKDGSIISHVALDAGSFRSLKDHWMRCKYEAYT